MTSNMTVKQEGSIVTITVNLDVDGNPPREPGSRTPNKRPDQAGYDKGTRNWGLASTGGNMTLGELINGREVQFGINFFSKDAPKATAAPIAANNGKRASASR